MTVNKRRQARNETINREFVSVARVEYEALIALRDGAHENLKIQLAAAAENFARLREVNLEQCHRMSAMELTATHHRTENLKQHDLILTMQRRLAELEPVKTAIPQPALGRKP